MRSSTRRRALRGSGLVALVVLVDEQFEIGDLFGRKDEGFCVDAGFEGVHGGSGLTCDRGGAGGFLGVAAVGFYLSESGHGGSWSPSFARMDRPEACPTLKVERWNWGFGVEYL